MSEPVPETVPEGEIPEPVETPEPGDEPETPGEPEPEPEGEPEGEEDLPESAEPEQIEGPGDEQQRRAKLDAEKEIEQQARKLEAEAKRHFGRVGEIMGDGADNLVACPLCWPLAPGLRWDREPEEEVKQQLRPLMGLPSIENYKRADNARECEGCDGLGQVLSGSRVVGKMVIQCAKCKGSGFVLVAGPTQLAADPDANGEQAVVFTDNETGLPTKDPWGRLHGDPLYGVFPGYEGARA